MIDYAHYEVGVIKPNKLRDFILYLQLKIFYIITFN